MPIAAAPGQPQYSGNFIPEVWSGKLVVKFYDATVFGDIANTDYEGEIKGMGDTVHIRTVPNITIRDYQKGGTLQTEHPDSPKIEFQINKAKYFQFAVDSIDKYQSDISLMDKWSADAGEQMKIAIDEPILASIPADVDAKNKGVAAGRKSGAYNLGDTGAPIALTAANVLEYITALASVGDEQNWPESGRWLVIPPWVRWLLVNSDLKNASITGDGVSTMRNGRIGGIDRFTIYVSNLLSVVTDGAFSVTNIMAGHKSGLTFASQMTEMDSLKSEHTFGTLVRGLNVFDHKVIKPESLARLYARRG